MLLHPDSHVATRTSVISLGEALRDTEDNLSLTCALVQRGARGVILHQDAIQTQISFPHRKTVTEHVDWVQHQAVLDILLASLILVFSSIGKNCVYFR